MAVECHAFAPSSVLSVKFGFGLVLNALPPREPNVEDLKLEARVDTSTTQVASFVVIWLARDHTRAPTDLSSTRRRHMAQNTKHLMLRAAMQTLNFSGWFPTRLAFNHTSERTQTSGYLGWALLNKLYSSGLFNLTHSPSFDKSHIFGAH